MSVTKPNKKGCSTNNFCPHDFCVTSNFFLFFFTPQLIQQLLASANSMLFQYGDEQIGSLQHIEHVHARAALLFVKRWLNKWPTGKQPSARACPAA